MIATAYNLVVNIVLCNREETVTADSAIRHKQISGSLARNN